MSTALQLAQEGVNATRIARMLGGPRSTVREWLAGVIPRRTRQWEDGRCLIDHRFSEQPSSYVYLLGLYLGDGSISTHPRGVYKLRLALDAKYPRIIATAAAAMREIRSGCVNLLRHRSNYVEVSAYWRHWPCLIPQHGPGKKHERKITLTDWQQQLINRWPNELVRGLIESDGCRFQNTGRNHWSWPRYCFRQKSDDIRAIFCAACSELSLSWTRANDTIYISRRADVALLDDFVGPKT